MIAAAVDRGHQLAMAAASEINDELTLILGATQLLDEGDEAVVTIAKAAWRCALITNRLVAWGAAHGCKLGRDGSDALFERLRSM